MILSQSYKEDLIDLLDNLSSNPYLENKFPDIDIEKVKQPGEDFDRLWTLYQKSVEEYGCDPEYAVYDALLDVFDDTYPVLETAKNPPSVDVHVFRMPAFVSYKCSLCGRDVKMGYEKFCENAGETPDERKNVRITCPECSHTIIIGSEDWD